MFENLEDLRKKAIEVECSDKERAYCTRYEILAFVIGGMMYAIPWSRTALKILTDEEFSRKDLKIPYGKDLITKDKEKYWNELVKQAHSDRTM